VGVLVFTFSSEHYGFFNTKTRRTRADDAAEDHVLVEVILAQHVRVGRDAVALELRKDGELLPLERGLEPVEKAHALAVPVIGGRLNDDADRAARVHSFPIGAAHLDVRDDLGAGGKDHRVQHSSLGAGRPVFPPWTRFRRPIAYWGVDRSRRLEYAQDMTVQSLKINGRRFVLVAESDFRRLEKQAAKPQKSSSKSVAAEDRADLEVARRRLSSPKEKRIPWRTVAKRAGIA